MINHPTGGTTMKSLVDHLSQYAAYHRPAQHRQPLYRHSADRGGGGRAAVASAMGLGGLWISPAVLVRWLRRGFTCAWNCAWVC
jgi:hypothetical protein